MSLKFVGHPECPDGKTASEALRPTHGVRFDLHSTVPKNRSPSTPVSGSTDTTLYFIEEEQQIVFFPQLRRHPEKFWSHQVNTPFPLNGFKQDPGGAFIDSLLQRFTIIQGNMTESGKQRVKPHFDLFLSGRRNSTECSAMKRSIDGNDPVFLRLASKAVTGALPGQLDESLVGFCPGIAKENFSGSSNHFFNEEFRQKGLFPDVIQIGTMNQLPALLHQSFPQDFRAVAQ